MVKHSAPVITPSTSCSCCGERFHQGDTAVCIVHLPDGEHDTICIDDWAVVLASSTMWLKTNPAEGVEPIKSLLRRALAAAVEETRL